MVTSHLIVTPSFLVTPSLCSHHSFWTHSSDTIRYDHITLYSHSLPHGHTLLYGNTILGFSGVTLSNVVTTPFESDDTTHQTLAVPTHFDSEDDYCIGCRNVSHRQQQQCYSGLRSPRQSYSTYLWNYSWVQTPHKLSFVVYTLSWISIYIILHCYTIVFNHYTFLCVFLFQVQPAYYKYLRPLMQSQKSKL